MVDTVRTRSYLSGTSFPSSKSGGITAQDIRDFVASALVISTGAGAPASAPASLFEMYQDSTTKTNWYVATGTSASTDWKQVALNGSSPTFGNLTMTSGSIVGSSTTITIKPYNITTLNIDPTGGVTTTDIDLGADFNKTLGFVNHGTGLWGPVFSAPSISNIQLGGSNAASPTAQTFSVQGVVAGTSNTAGQDWTINGSVGTGTGVGGAIKLQTAPAGSTGTTRNALVTVLNLLGDGSISMPNLATADPHVAHTLWNNSGVLTVSAG